MARISAVFSLLAALLLASGCSPHFGAGPAFPLSPTQETALGKKIFPLVVQEMGGAYPDAQLQAYVNEVGMRLLRQSRRPAFHCRFEVANDSTPNAVALPGGFIVVTRGMLVALSNEAELAALLGHEVAHVVTGQVAAKLQKGAQLKMARSVLAAGNAEAPSALLVDDGGKLAGKLIALSFRPNQERQADRLAMDDMARANYNPEGMLQLQALFVRRLRAGRRSMWRAGLFHRHPFSEVRLEATRSYLRSQYSRDLKRLDLPSDSDPFRAATAQLRQSEKGYALYDKARELEKEGKLPQAVDSYLRATAAAPDEALIRTGLGMAYLKAGDINAARHHLALAVREDEGYYYSHLGLGYVYLQKGEIKRALKELNASMDLLPTASGGYLLAEGYEKSGERQKALDLYQAVARIAPDGALGRAAARRIPMLKGN